MHEHTNNRLWEMVGIYCIKRYIQKTHISWEKNITITIKISTKIFLHLQKLQRQIIFLNIIEILGLQTLKEKTNYL